MDREKTQDRSKIVRTLRLLHLRRLLMFIALCVALLCGSVIYQDHISKYCILVPEVQTNEYHQRGRYDKYRRYVIQDSIFVGARWPGPYEQNSNRPDVCLATQTSIEVLHHVIEVGYHWQSWISLAIYDHWSDRNLVADYLEYLETCHEAIAQNLSVHLVFPVGPKPLEAPQYRYLCERETRDCECWHKELTAHVTKVGHQSTGMPNYPQNLMRNVARKNCVSPYVLLTDMDVIPMYGLGPKLQTFLQGSRHDNVSKCAYVLPTYEMTSNKSQPLPIDKRELLELVRTKRARPYRSKAFKPNQGATNSSKWERLPTNLPDNIQDIVPTVAYEVPTFKFYYEPFYLAKDDVPEHDSRFVGYGFTRNTQVYEMLLAGYRFFVLDNAFLVHRGMGNDPYAHSKTRKKQVKHSLKRLFRFMTEIKIRYLPLKGIRSVKRFLQTPK